MPQLIKDTTVENPPLSIHINTIRLIDLYVNFTNTVAKITYMLGAVDPQDSTGTFIPVPRLLTLELRDAEFVAFEQAVGADPEKIRVFAVSKIDIPIDWDWLSAAQIV